MSSYVSAPDMLIGTHCGILFSPCTLKLLAGCGSVAGWFYSYFANFFGVCVTELRHVHGCQGDHKDDRVYIIASLANSDF